MRNTPRPTSRSRLRLAPLVLAAALPLAAGSLAACSGMSGLQETQVHGIVVNDGMLQQVKPGTRRQAVLDTLGTPSTTSTIGGDAYYYVSQTTVRPIAFMAPHEVDRTVFAVYFDTKDTVSRVANYGMKDGAVFDYVTRTTPTAGGEQSFLRQLTRGLLSGIPGINS